MPTSAITAEVPGFCRSLPTQPRIWDATRLRIAQQCWRKHWYATVLGLRRNGGSSVHQEFGSFYHEAVERYDLALLKGTAPDEARGNVLGWLLETARQYGGEREDEDIGPWGGTVEECWQCTDPPTRPHKRRPGVMVENKERCVWAKQASPLMPVYCDFEEAAEHKNGCAWHCQSCGLPAVKTVRYLPSHPTKHLVSLIRAFLLYTDTPETVELFQFPEDARYESDVWYECSAAENCVQNSGPNCPGCTACCAEAAEPKPAVEMFESLPLALQSPDGVPYELVGLLDSLVLWEGDLTIRERKTTSRRFTADYWSQFDLDPQTDTYDLLMNKLYPNANGGAPIRLLMETMRVGRGDAELRRMPLPPVSDGRREEWLREVQKIISEAEARAQMATTVARLEQSVDAPWPRNISACHGPYGDCPFIELCRAAPADRGRLIAENYHEERWNPLQGDE